MASLTPGRALAEAASTALLGAPTNGTVAGGNPAGAETPYMRRTAAAEGDAGRYPVTAAFLRLLVALLARRCVDTQLHVRGSPCDGLSWFKAFKGSIKSKLG